jgi:hypothetical protein
VLDDEDIVESTESPAGSSWDINLRVLFCSFWVLLPARIASLNLRPSLTKVSSHLSLPIDWTSFCRCEVEVAEGMDSVAVCVVRLRCAGAGDPRFAIEAIAVSTDPGATEMGILAS